MCVACALLVVARSAARWVRSVAARALRVDEAARVAGVEGCAGVDEGLEVAGWIHAWAREVMGEAVEAEGGRGLVVDEMLQNCEQCCGAGLV